MNWRFTKTTSREERGREGAGADEWPAGFVWWISRVESPPTFLEVTSPLTRDYDAAWNTPASPPTPPPPLAPSEGWSLKPVKPAMLTFASVKAICWLSVLLVFLAILPECSSIWGGLPARLMTTASWLAVIKWRALGGVSRPAGRTASFIIAPLSFLGTRSKHATLPLEQVVLTVCSLAGGVHKGNITICLPRTYFAHQLSY